MTLADLLRTEMGAERRIDIELGATLGEVVTPSSIENSLVRERNEILDAARQAKFRAQDGAWRPVRELNCDACGDDEALICGDLMHHMIQCHLPAWSTIACADREAARATREAFLERYAETDTTILPSHFPDPTAGRIVPEGAAFAFRYIGE